MGQVPKWKRPWNLAHCSKDSRKLMPLLISIHWPSLVTSWVVPQKIYLKMYLAPCTNTHRDVTDSINDGMVKYTKTCISWERNMICVRNKKILNLCLIWHIFKSYHFVTELTFKYSLLTKTIHHHQAKHFYIKNIPVKGNFLTQK